MNVLITAGATTEKIDSVRSIVNTSTGRLGALIAEAFVKKGNKVFYICGQNAALPNLSQGDGFNLRRVTDVSNLQDALSDFFSCNNAHVIVHAMAVSDFRVKAVTTLRHIKDSVEFNLANNGKIPSDIDDAVLLLEKNPKIIGLLREMSPNSKIIGFKLLDGSTKEVLLETGFKLLINNKLDFVLANDLTEIFGEVHRGYLIDKNYNYNHMQTKKEIAEAIVRASLSTL